MKLKSPESKDPRMSLYTTDRMHSTTPTYSEGLGFGKGGYACILSAGHPTSGDQFSDDFI